MGSGEKKKERQIGQNKIDLALFSEHYKPKIVSEKTESESFSDNDRSFEIPSFDERMKAVNELKLSTESRINESEGNLQK